MTSLVEFILARIGADEAAATAALTAAPSYGSINDNAFAELLDLADNEGASEAAGKHAQLWAPARVLAECESKRRIVALHSGRQAFNGDGTFDPSCTGSYDEFEYYAEECHTLRALAAVYADHADYDEAWRP